MGDPLGLTIPTTDPNPRTAGPLYAQDENDALERIRKAAQDACVLNFGADDTGGTDSSSAFALAYAQKRKLYIPEGSYLVQDHVMELPHSALLGDGSEISQLYLAGANGIRMKRQKCVLKGLGIYPSDSSSTVTRLVNLSPDVAYKEGIHHFVLEDVEINGTNLSGKSGLYIEGVYGNDLSAPNNWTAGSYYGSLRHVNITRCPVDGLSFVTAHTDSRTVISDISKQRNGAHLIEQVTINNCGRSWYEDTVVPCVFINPDFEVNTVEAHLDHSQAQVMLGYGPANDGAWEGDSLNQIIPVGWSVPPLINAGAMVIADPQQPGAIQLPSLMGGRYTDFPGGVSRGIVQGGNHRRLGWDEPLVGFPPALTSSSNTQITLGTYSPNAIQVPSGKTWVGHYKARIRGVERGGLGGVAIFEVNVGVKAVNSSGTITVSIIDSPDYVKHRSDTNWDIAVGIDGSGTYVRCLAHGAVGSGTIDWECTPDLAEVRQGS